MFTPNTVVNYQLDGLSYDIDYTSQQEGRDLQRPTYSAVTARSYHSGGVNAVFMDGSVEFVTDSVDVMVWRSWGTAGGNELTESLP